MSHNMVHTSEVNVLGNLYPYVIALMQDEGRDFNLCELCGTDIADGEFEIHHTKYEGATYYDLRISCRRCNRLPENINLA